MNDADLKQRLSAFVAPPATDGSRERARHRALIAFREEGGEAAPAYRRPVAVWVLAGAAALAIAGALSSRWDSDHDRVGSEAAILAQFEALFPAQLDAVIDHDGEVQLALAAAPQRASDQPILVEFRRGSSTVRVLSYSGRRVCVDLGGRRTCFEVLLNERGTVIVAGDDFVWSAQDHATADGWKITAAALERAS